MQKYGGFYVARYEAGIPEEMTGVYLTGTEECVPNSLSIKIVIARSQKTTCYYSHFSD